VTNEASKPASWRKRAALFFRAALCEGPRRNGYGRDEMGNGTSEQVQARSNTIDVLRGWALLTVLLLHDSYGRPSAPRATSRLKLRQSVDTVSPHGFQRFCDLRAEWLPSSLGQVAPDYFDAQGRESEALALPRPPRLAGQDLHNMFELALREPSRV
jgi:hypothetical protein